MAHLDIWFDFASTYSYPAIRRLPPLARAAGVAVRFRPFLLGPIFAAQGWSTSPFNLYPAKGAYMWRDMERVCAALGLPFVRPSSFPQASLLAARLALAEGASAAFVQAVFDAQFAAGHDIGDSAVLAAILRTQGKDADALLTLARSEGIKARLRAETGAAERRGIFGAPSFMTEGGELFWGNDRLEQALDGAKRETALAAGRADPQP